MDHSHAHHHHSHEIKNVSSAFVAGIILNGIFVVAEFAAGFYYNSLALLSDAGHNLSDVVALALSLFAFKLAQSKSNDRFTYGLHKSTILASLVNAIILLIAIGSIGWEAIQRFLHPVQVQGNVISLIAGLGIVVNGVSAFLFFRQKEQELNSKGAFLHLLVDALVSAGVVIAGLFISYTGKTWIDPLISLIIMLVVLLSTWSLLKESLRLSLDAVPAEIDIEKIRQEVLKTEGVKDIHHIHVWAMSTSKNAMTAHLILEKNYSTAASAEIKNKLKHKLLHLNIQHATLETENESDICEDDCE